MGNGDWLSESTFQKAETDTKLSLLRDGIEATHKKLLEGHDIMTDHENRIKGIEGARKIDRACAGIIGAFSGLGAVVIKLAFWK